MNRLTDSIIFSFIVSLPMVMLDVLYHLATETAVHINYVAVKFTIIYLTLFLVTYWVGKSWNDAVFATIAGPVLFYIYYVFADPTINRDVFKIDDSFGYIFLHIAVFALSYAVVRNLIDHSAQGQRGLAVGKAFAFAFAVFGLDAAYQMLKVQLATHDEEIVARVMSVDTSLYIVLSLLLVGFLLYNYVSNIKIQSAALVLSAVLLIWLIGMHGVRAFVGLASAGIPVGLIYLYTRER